MFRLGILAHSVEGAALCFRAFAQAGFDELGPHLHPDVSLDCVAMGHSMAAWDSGDYASIRATLARSVERLALSGADVFICPDNTAHLALELPGNDLELPGLHIADVVADHAARAGRERVGILGTSYTMAGPVSTREHWRRAASRQRYPILQIASWSTRSSSPNWSTGSSPWTPGRAICASSTT